MNSDMYFNSSSCDFDSHEKVKFSTNKQILRTNDFTNWNQSDQGVLEWLKEVRCGAFSVCRKDRLFPSIERGEKFVIDLLKAGHLCAPRSLVRYLAFNNFGPLVYFGGKASEKVKKFTLHWPYTWTSIENNVQDFLFFLLVEKWFQWNCRIFTKADYTCFRCAILV